MGMRLWLCEKESWYIATPCILLQRIRVKGLFIRAIINAWYVYATCWTMRVQRSSSFTHTLWLLWQSTASRVVLPLPVDQSVLEAIGNCLLAFSLFTFTFFLHTQKWMKHFHLLLLFFRGVSTSQNDWGWLPCYNCSNYVYSQHLRLW